MTVPIYLINLCTSPHRLTTSQQRLAEQNIDFIRVEAVSGKALTAQQIARHYSEEINTQKYHSALTKGQIGCYFSHRKTWQLIAEGEFEFAVILEDDFELSGDLTEAIETVSKLDFQWDLIKLAAYQSRQRKIAFQQAINSNFNIVIHQKPMSGGAATAITKTAAKKLLAATDKFGRPCDTDIQHFWETGVEVLSLLPYPVKQDMNFVSTIAAQNQPRKKHFWRRKIQQLDASRKNRIAVKNQIQALQQQLTLAD